MPRLIAAKAFDGFQTLDNLADEIVYRYCAAADRSDSAMIRPEDVQFISEPGGYIDRFTSKAPNPKHKPIGFQSVGEWP